MKRGYILPIFLVFQIIFLKIMVFFPEVIEQLYSNYLYVYSSKFSRILLGKIPFSVGDVLYIVLILWILRSIYNSKTLWKHNWKNIVLKTLSFVSVFYFAFHILWGLNYYRVPLFEKMAIKRDYSDEQLYAFTEKIIAKTNAIQLAITKNKNIKVRVPYSQETIFKMTKNGYSLLSKTYPFFKYETPSIKKSVFSLPLTYMGFGGYLNPFTNEAQVNYKLPDYGFPMVTTHEMAHQMGYASESECNFIGFLACIKNEDLYFQYAAYTTTLRYCLRSIESRQKHKAAYFLQKINGGVLANFKESDIFWKSYQTPIEKGFELFYDQFLKLNQQEDGLEGYSKFLNLLINYDTQKTIF